MTEEQKQRVAVFRFGIIHEFLDAVRLDHGEQEELLRRKCERRWDIPFSSRSSIGRSTILRWIHQYTESGGKLESLYPQQRNDQGKPRAFDEETSLALVECRRKMPELTVPALIHIMHDQKLVPAGISLNPSTVYRFLHSAKKWRSSTTKKVRNRWRFAIRKNHGAFCARWICTSIAG